MVFIYVSLMGDYKTAPAIKKPNNTDKLIAITPGTKNGWLNTYLPIRVEPVSSISTAAIKVGYVGRINNADTAANAAIAASGETPNKIAVGYNAFAVAACE